MLNINLLYLLNPQNLFIADESISLANMVNDDDIIEMVLPESNDSGVSETRKRFRSRRH